jgi:hypothetical protein
MNERFIVMFVECSRCKTKQKVHVAARPGPTLITNEMIRCLNFDHHFRASVPDKIVAGPVPT